MALYNTYLANLQYPARYPSTANASWYHPPNLIGNFGQRMAMRTHDLRRLKILESIVPTPKSSRGGGRMLTDSTLSLPFHLLILGCPTKRDTCLEQHR